MKAISIRYNIDRASESQKVEFKQFDKLINDFQDYRKSFNKYAEEVEKYPAINNPFYNKLSDLIDQINAIVLNNPLISLAYNHNGIDILFSVLNNDFCLNGIQAETIYNGEFCYKIRNKYIETNCKNKPFQFFWEYVTIQSLHYDSDVSFGGSSLFGILKHYVIKKEFKRIKKVLKAHRETAQFDLDSVIFNNWNFSKSDEENIKIAIMLNKCTSIRDYSIIKSLHFNNIAS